MSRTHPPLSPPPPRFIRHRRTPRAGFTIIELMIAGAITLVVLGLMLQITFSVLKTFDKVSGSLSSRNEATTVLRFLREDFQSIVWRRDKNVWLLATIQPDQTTNGGRGDTNIATADWTLTGTTGAVPKPGVGTVGDYGQEHSSLRMVNPASTGVNDRTQPLENYRFGQAGVWLRFFTNRTTADSDFSAPIAVAYQIVRMTPRGNSGEQYRYQFFRSAVRPGPVGTSANAQRSVLKSGYNLTDATYNDNTSLTATNGLPESLRKPDREVLIANNVIDFGVRFWRRDPATGTLTLLFPADSTKTPPVPSNTNYGFAVTTLAPADITATGASGIPYGSLSNAQLSTGFPDFADVFLRVLTDEGARLIEAYENGYSIAPSASGTPTNIEKMAYWWKIAEEHSEVFTERIPLQARPF